MRPFLHACGRVCNGRIQQGGAQTRDTMSTLDWSQKRCIVLDMDGTIYLGSTPIAPAVEGIIRNWERFDFRFLSNNTSHSPVSYVKKLNAMGIPARLEQFVTPTEPLALHLGAHGFRRAYIVGNDDFKAHLHSLMPSLIFTAEDAECVILAYDTDLTYEKLSTSALLLQDEKVHFFATHPDLVCPSPKGPLPDVGSFLALYRTATGRVPEKIFGKPDPAILAPVFASYEKSQVVMCGDRLSTDKALAENAGINFILVLSGEATAEDAAKEKRAPTLMVDNLGCALPE